MSVIASFRVAADEFPLGELLEVRSGIRVQLESVVPLGDAVIPYLSVPIADADAVHTALRESPFVEEAHVADETESQTLFRVTWSPDVNGLLDAIDDSEGTVLESEGLGDHWSFRIRFPRREHLSAFYRDCADRGIALDVREVNHTRPFGDAEIPLTEPQREALLAALDEGYYRIPRDLTLEELARKLGISDTALSQRLRRGLTVLLTSTLTDRGTDTHDDDHTD